MEKNPGPIFVGFSGIDGAGKSTQIANLRAHMNAAGLRVHLITFWDDVAKFTRLREASGHALFKGDKGVGSPDAPINRRDKNVRSWPMTIIRLGLYFVDAVSLRRVVKRALKSGADFIIFDRYAYDEMANLDLNNPVSRAYARLVLGFVPRPHISYLLDANPAEARARKPEYPLDFLYTCRRSYLALNDLLGGVMTIIPPGTVEEVERNVLKPALKRLAFEGIQTTQSEIPSLKATLSSQLNEHDVNRALS